MTGNQKVLNAVSARVMGGNRNRGADDASRAVLDQAATENFPVAPFFLPRAWRGDLMAVYGFARLVDDIGDGDLPPGGSALRPGGRDAELLGLGPDWDGDRIALLGAFEKDLRRVFGEPSGEVPRHPLLRVLQPTVRRRRLTVEPFLGLIAANRRDQQVSRYATYGELLDYCELSANPVGRLVLQIAGVSSPERIRRSDAVCTALQIVEHLQDVAEDLGRDRIYLPAEDMKRFGVGERDLGQPVADGNVRALIAFEADRAAGLLDEGAPLVGSVRGRLRLLLAGFVAGGRAALKAIRAADHDVLPGPPKPTKPVLLREVGATLRREG